MAYIIFSVVAIFVEKLAKQNCQFLEFSKNKKKGDFVQKIWPLGCGYDFFLGVYLIAFSVGYVVAYSIFSVGAILVEKFAKQYCLFLEFSKKIEKCPF